MWWMRATSPLGLFPPPGRGRTIARRSGGDPTDAVAVTPTPLAAPADLPLSGGGEVTASLMFRCSCFDSHARIDQAIENVDQQVERDVHHRHRQHKALHRREIGGDQGLYGE